MNLLLFDRRDRLDAERIVLRDRRLQHLLQVLGARVGDRLRVGEIDGMLGSGEILELGAGEAVVEVTLDRPPPAKLPLILVLGLPRPKMLRRILRAVAEFGVPELHLINTRRVEKSFWQTPVLRAETLRQYLLQGLEQCSDTVLPAVHCHRLFRPFAEDLLPSLTAGRRALLAHPGDYPDCPHGMPQDTIAAIGPEGGFIDFELGRLTDAGFAPVALGPRILRVEHALCALLGRLAP